MKKLIKRYEVYIYFGIYFLGLFSNVEMLENIGVSLYLIFALRIYYQTKKLSEYLSLLFTIPVFCLIIILNISSDIKVIYIALYIILFLVISIIIKFNLSTKLHYNPKFWNQYSILVPLFVLLISSFALLCFVSFKPSFIGEFHYQINDNIEIFYDRNENIDDVKLIEETLYNYDQFSENFHSLKLKDVEKNYELYIYVGKKWWDDDVISEIYYLYEKAINRSGISKKLIIFYEVNTIFGKLIKQNDWITQESL